MATKLLEAYQGSYEGLINVDGDEWSAVIDYIYSPMYQEYEIKRVQMEVFDGVYADLQENGFAVIAELMTHKEFWDE